MNRWIPLLFLLGAGITGCSTYNAYIAHSMQKSYDNIERDPDTGIMKGAEPIFLEGKGSGAVLLIHGFIATPADFGRLPHLLNDAGWTVYAPLLPGHGTDPRDFSKTTPDELIDFTKNAYINLRKKHKKVVVIGHSMGGALAVITAADSDVDRLVLLAPYFKIAHQWYYLLPTEIIHKIAAPFIPYVYRPLMFKQLNKKESIPYIIDYDYVSLKGGKTAMDIGKRAHSVAYKLNIPVLFIHSKKDKATDYSAARKVASQLPEKTTRFVTLHKSNHIILWDYEAALVEAEILKFIESDGE